MLRQKIQTYFSLSFVDEFYDILQNPIANESFSREFSRALHPHFVIKKKGIRLTISVNRPVSLASSCLHLQTAALKESRAFIVTSFLQRDERITRREKETKKAVDRNKQARERNAWKGKREHRCVQSIGRIAYRKRSVHTLLADFTASHAMYIQGNFLSRTDRYVSVGCDPVPPATTSIRGFPFSLTSHP